MEGGRQKQEFHVLQQGTSNFTLISRQTIDHFVKYYAWSSAVVLVQPQGQHQLKTRFWEGAYSPAFYWRFNIETNARVPSAGGLEPTHRSPQPRCTGQVV